MKKIKEYFDNLFPNPICELKFSTEFELLVAVILSAQCTDKRVNEVVKNLFKEYSTPEKICDMTTVQLENIIKPCGFYHNKAKNIKRASEQIINDFGGKVPSTIEQLQSLAGVGKKTANVVYSVAFGGDAIAVDTHVFRVSKRLGLSKATTPEKCELDLEKIFKKSDWSKLHQQMVLFGRYNCTARSPKCERCELHDICKYKK